MTCAGIWAKNCLPLALECCLEIGAYRLAGVLPHAPQPMRHLHCQGSGVPHGARRSCRRRTGDYQGVDGLIHKPEPPQGRAITTSGQSHYHLNFGRLVLLYSPMHIFHRRYRRIPTEDIALRLHDGPIGFVELQGPLATGQQ
jgi:hypothetical protein